MPGFSRPDALHQFLLELVYLRRGLKRVGLAIHGQLWKLNKLSSWRGWYTIVEGIESQVRIDRPTGVLEGSDHGD